MLSLIDDGNTPLEKILEKNSNTIQVIFENASKKQAIATAEKFLKAINPGDFENIRFRIASEDRQKLIDTLMAHRSGLICSEDRKLLKCRRFSDIRENAYKRVTTDIVPSVINFGKDPFFLLSNYLGEILSTQSGWKVSNGFISTKNNSKHYILVTLMLKKFSSGIVSSLQKTAEELREIEDLTKAESRKSKTRIFLSGPPIHSAIEMQKSTKQINYFSAISVIFSIVLLYMLLRKFWYIIPVAINMASAFFIGYCGLQFFPKIHLITFIFATSLIGLSVDYSFHFFSTPKQLRSKLVKSMFQAYATTCVCFLPLFFSNLSLLKQVATFTILGLTTVFVNTVVFYPLLEPGKCSKNIRLPRLSKKFYIVAFLFAVIGVSGSIFHTNITDLYKPDDVVIEADKLFMDLSGKTKSKFLLITANNLEEALQKEEKIRKEVEFFGASSIVPSIKSQKANQKMMEQLFREQAGVLKEKLNSTQKISFEKTPVLLPEDVRELTDPFIIRGHQQVFLLVPVRENLNFDFSEVSGVSIFEPKKCLEEKLNQYEDSIYKSLIISGILMFVLLFIFYGKIFAYIVPSLLSVFCVLSILNLIGVSIHLFHLLACFIVIGVGIDYTIFNLSGFSNKAVVFSFLSTLVGLGMLFFSSFPVLSSMGFVFGIGLLLSFLFSLCCVRDNLKKVDWE
ncbi:MAG: hypothetical protein J5821_00345 [Alphaproteobacteria bacterium]|nr:hypothetical protein [Alphaproteobacteria bacterium]